MGLFRRVGWRCGFLVFGIGIFREIGVNRVCEVVDRKGKFFVVFRFWRLFRCIFDWGEWSNFGGFLFGVI